MKYSIYLACVLLTGCVVGPNYQRPDLAAQLPKQYQRIEDGPSNQQVEILPDRWWLTFNDSAINQLVDAALLRNLDLASADANIRQARAQLGIIDSASQPQLNANGDISHDQFSKNSELMANIPFPNPRTMFNDYKAGFDASWEIDLFGHTARSIEAAKARLNSIEQQREGVALRVAAEVTRNVIDYRAWQLRSKNAEAIFVDSQHLLDLMQLQQKAGLLSDSDVTEAQTALHNAAAAIPPLQAATLASMMAITVLIDQPQEQVATILQANADIPAVPAHIDSIGLPSDLLLRRPDLRIAERELAAATADIGVAKAEQYPQLTLLASGGLDSITPGKLTNLASRYWNIGPQLSIPLFTGGRLAAQVNSREAARDAALSNYRQAVLSAFSDTEIALIRYQREQQRLTQIKQAFASQHRQLEFAEQRYQLGETNFSYVLQTRQQLAQTNELQLASQQALAENLTALFKSLGGGFNEKPAQ
ncbi:efflux transporter outer membrane subunit [Solimicrobium silvestre]|uniref:Efflux transporter, outer membrane factor (OMF) lipoprotein, NodT family n=1 Tax=Solimicrobium silvestre TaxID=2099400 RepID=A0A2S9GSL4_9BURK|nr:efflux transporter outer membrane subunit [Solimicrobium silvestre]PRC90703.1 Efflux transporter, outer membrane factor (OMF) lipoprotein, NodT family [Solimicrobium silvestre]